jgi:hypothetical protein
MELPFQGLVWIPKAESGEAEPYRSCSAGYSFTHLPGFPSSSLSSCIDADTWTTFSQWEKSPEGEIVQHTPK